MNGFCPENYLNLLKQYLYGEYINEYLTFYEASFNYTKQAVVSGRPFFYLFWVYSSAFAFMRATRFSVLIFESDSESRHQCAAFLFDVFHFVSLFRQWIRRVFNHSGTHINIRLFEGTLRHILQVDIKA